MWPRVWVDSCRTHDEEALPSPMFIHADDVVRRRRIESRENAWSFWFFPVSYLGLVCYTVTLAALV